MKLYLFFGLLCVISSSMGLSDEEIEIFRMKAGQRRCGSEGVDITVTADSLKLETDGVPDHIWGCVNPNTPSPIDISITVPRNPEFDKDGPYCLSMGAVAMAINGVAMFNPFAERYVNAVQGKEQEEFDCCGGHTEKDGTYHYHQLPVSQGGCDNPIVKSLDQPTPQLIGVAYDGFPIYSQWNDLDSTSLDECHGMILPGTNTYAYVSVYKEYPYILGCFKGKPVAGSTNTKCTNMKPLDACSCTVGAKTKEEVTDNDISSIMSDIAKVDDVMGLYKSYGDSDKARLSKLFQIMRKKREVAKCGHSECRDIMLKRQPWFNNANGYCECGGTDEECGCPDRGCPKVGQGSNSDGQGSTSDGRGPPTDGRGPPPDGRGPPPDGRGPP